MAIILVEKLKLGYDFSQTWPKREPYLQPFKQTRVIKLADLSLTAAPIIAFFTLFFQLNYLGMEALHLSLAMSLLILSLPLHGYFLLGQQATERLPSGLRSWYREIEHKIKQEENQNLRMQLEANNKPKADHKLTYMDLAKLLKVLFERK